LLGLLLMNHPLMAILAGIVVINQGEALDGLRLLLATLLLLDLLALALLLGLNGQLALPHQQYYYYPSHPTIIKAHPVPSQSHHPLLSPTHPLIFIHISITSGSLPQLDHALPAAADHGGRLARMPLHANAGTSVSV
jgi:hypothetical protein